MSAIGNSYFTKRPSAWAEMKAWRESQSFYTSNFAAVNSGAIDSLMSASASRIDGAASLAAQAALTRIQNATKAKAAQTADDSAKSDIAWTPPKSSTVYLPDGTTIDLDGNTMTMPNGTVIDVTTGLPVVNVVA